MISILLVCLVTAVAVMLLAGSRAPILVELVEFAQGTPFDTAPLPTGTQGALPGTRPPPTELPSSTPLAVPTSTPSSAASPSPVIVEPTPDPLIIIEAHGCEPPPAGTMRGMADVERPVHMSPGGNDYVVLSLYVPDQLVSTEPMQIERVKLPEDVPVVRGELDTYQSSIQLAPVMRVELTSNTFEVDELYPASQPVNLDQVNRPTIWSWEITAPDREGVYDFALQAFWGDNEQSCWFRPFEVNVSGAPAQPQTPPLLVWGLVAVLLANGLLVAGLVYALRKKPRGAAAYERGSARRHGYNLKAVHELLRTGFGPDELRRLCLEDDELRPLLDNLDAQPSLNEIVDAIIVHCERHRLFDVLLTQVRERNPKQYARFEPALRS